MQSPDTLVNIRKFSSLEEIQREASAEVVNTGGYSLPVVCFHQGTRWMLTGALPFTLVKSRLEKRSAEKQGSLHNTRMALNRPELQEHSRVIANYLKENYSKKYIVPPLTLNIQQAVNLYTFNYASEFLPGFLVIPATAKLAITDGQHRRSAIITALEELEGDAQDQLSRDAVAVMISCETDVPQIHQDFADCSKTKALPPSLLAVYDLRNPANRLVAGLEQSCILFKDRIDSTSKTLSKKSTYLFLANQIRQLVKELLVGSYATADPQFEKRAFELLDPESHYDEAVRRYSEYINYLTEQIPIWKDIAATRPGIEASQIPAKRAEGWVCLTATGLNLIGRVGHLMIRERITNWREYADKLAQLDWRKSSEIWQGNIIKGDKVMTQQVPLREGYEKVVELVGLSRQRKLAEVSEQRVSPILALQES
jgi:DNA sulfur modification protein DndB